MYMLPSVVWQSKDPRLQTRFGKHSPLRYQEFAEQHSRNLSTGTTYPNWRKKPTVAS